MHRQTEIFNSLTSETDEEVCTHISEKITTKAIRIHQMEFEWQKYGTRKDWERWFVKVSWTEFDKSKNTYTFFKQEALLDAYDIAHVLKKQ